MGVDRVLRVERLAVAVSVRGEPSGSWGRPTGEAAALLLPSLAWAQAPRRASEVLSDVLMPSSRAAGLVLGDWLALGGGVALAAVLLALGVGRRRRAVGSPWRRRWRPLRVVWGLALAFALLLFTWGLRRWLLPLWPWVVLALAGAVGFSAKDVLLDLGAAIALWFERDVAPGRWLEGSGFSGQVIGLGPRVLRLRTSTGVALVPNRLVLTQVLRCAPRWPTVRCEVVCEDIPADEAISRLEAVVATSIYAPPGARAEISSSGPHRFEVRAPALDPDCSSRLIRDIQTRASRPAED